MPLTPGNAFAQQNEEARLKRIEQIEREAAARLEMEAEGYNTEATSGRPETTTVGHGPSEVDTPTVSNASNSAQRQSRRTTFVRPPQFSLFPTSTESAEEHHIRSTTLEVPSTRRDLPSTAGTTMTALLGPETENEKKGRRMRREQRESMEARLKRKQSQKSRPSNESSRDTTQRTSAMPAPLFRGKLNKVRNMFKKNDTAATTTVDLDKPLPALSTEEAAYAQTHGGHVPGAYIPPPMPVRNTPPRTYSPAYMNRYAQGYRPVSGQDYSQQDVVVPSISNAQAFIPDEDDELQTENPEQVQEVSSSAGNVTGHVSTQTFETNPSQYVRRGNEGMIFSNHLLTPTRAGGFATFGQPQVVHQRSMMSMRASVVDAQSPAATRYPPRVSSLEVPAIEVTPEVQELDGSGPPGLAERDESLAALARRVAAMEEKLDTLIEGVRSLGVGQDARGGRVRRGVGARLAAPPPHVPWGSQSMNQRAREPSAGLGGGVEGEGEWFRGGNRAE